MELNTIVKIHKYKGLHEGHHFIPMAMELHNAFERDMDHFIKECARLSMIDDQKVIYLCLFTFNFCNVLVFFLVCFNLCYREEDCIEWWCMF